LVVAVDGPTGFLPVNPAIYFMVSAVTEYGVSTQTGALRRHQTQTLGTSHGLRPLFEADLRIL